MILKYLLKAALLATVIVTISGSAYAEFPDPRYRYEGVAALGNFKIVNIAGKLQTINISPALAKYFLLEGDGSAFGFGYWARGNSRLLGTVYEDFSVPVNVVDRKAEDGPKEANYRNLPGNGKFYDMVFVQAGTQVTTDATGRLDFSPVGNRKIGIVFGTVY